MRSLEGENGSTVVCDALVAGGGVAGVAAAVAAARAGSRVVLLEKETVLGGTGTRGMLQTICGLYLNGGAEPVETLNGGLSQEVVAALRTGPPERKPVRVGKVFVLPYAPADLQQVLADLCWSERNLTVLSGAVVLAASAADGRVTAVTAEHAGKILRFQPRVAIDCTGTGDLSALAGAEFDLASPEEIQLAGWIARVRGLRESDDSLALKVPFVLAGLDAEGRLSPGLRFTTFAPGEAPQEGYLKFSVPGGGAEEYVREEAGRVLKLLAERVPAFRDAVIDGTSQGVFPREGRRVRGDYTLTAEDVLAARKFPDGVVRNAWPIELWDPERGPVYRYVPTGDYYEIPFRCLKVKYFVNLLVAGRCISASHEALGSTRVMGTCLALGEQAGCAAGRFAATGKYAVSPEENN